MPQTVEEVFASSKSTDDDVGFFESALAGVATGLWNIPKGFVSLGAELYDLVCNGVEISSGVGSGGIGCFRKQVKG